MKIGDRVSVHGAEGLVAALSDTDAKVIVTAITLEAAASVLPESFHLLSELHVPGLEDGTFRVVVGIADVPRSDLVDTEGLSAMLDAVNERVAEGRALAEQIVDEAKAEATRIHREAQMPAPPAPAVDVEPA